MPIKTLFVLRVIVLLYEEIWTDSLFKHPVRQYGEVVLKDSIEYFQIEILYHGITIRYFAEQKVYEIEALNTALSLINDLQNFFKEQLICN